MMSAHNSEHLETYQIQIANDLISEAAFQYIIKDLRKHIVAPSKDFEILYQATIHNYAEYIQSLPNTFHSPFNIPKGQLFLALSRVNSALAVSDNFPCPSTTKKLTSIEHEKRMAIWQFAVFSAALLCDLGPCLTRFEIHTCTNDGKNLTLWPAIKGISMMQNLQNNTHYVYNLLNNALPGANITAVIAKDIIPDYIFRWLSDEQDIFIEWLSLLHSSFFDGSSNYSDPSILHKLIFLSVEQLLALYSNQSIPRNVLHLIPKHLLQRAEYHKDSFWKGVEYSLRDKKDKKTETFHEDNEAGIAFLNWLKKGINDKTIPVNSTTGYVHVASQGLFLINPEIFLKFCKHFPKYLNWLAVFKQFNNLGLTEFNNPTIQANFSHLKEDQTKRGILIKDPRNIFGNHMIPVISPQMTIDPYTEMKSAAIYPVPTGEIASHTKRPNKLDSV